MATAKLSFTKLVVLALAAAVLVELSAAATHIVGDTTGWVNNPSGGATFYSNWASKQTFATGDILVFNYATGGHTVATVTKNAYDTCNTTSYMSIDKNSPTNINLNVTGENYFLCTVDTHCTQGQKLAINVTSSTTAPSPGAPSSPPTNSSLVSPPPPPPSSAPPKAVAAFAVVLMSIAIGVMC